MGETVHISLGPTANAVSSHLVNLYGAAATSSSSSNNNNYNNEESSSSSSLCDPIVTHEVISDNRSRHQHYLAPRMLMVDTRDCFPSQLTSSLPYSNTNENAVVSSWNGAVEIQHHHNNNNDAVYDKSDLLLDQYHRGAMTLCKSRFEYAQHTSFNGNNSNTQWNDSEEEEEEEYHDESPEEKRRRLERMQERENERIDRVKVDMETLWGNMFYDERMMPRNNGTCTRVNENQTVMANEEEEIVNIDDCDNNNNLASKDTSTHPTETTREQRDIHWYQYLLPTTSQEVYNNNNYQVPLPFDSSTNVDSYSMGYNSNNNNDSNNLLGSWREDVLSESIRKLLERCDQIKGFNLVVDGGSHSTSQLYNTAAQCNVGGGFYAGLATSILEELHDECKSAGRFAVLIDSLLNEKHDHNNDMSSSCSNNDPMESIQRMRFRKRFNAGLAIHGLSSNADAFLPVSIERAHKAFYYHGGEDTANDRMISYNRMLFEGSAALALALETSTLSYRLNTHPRDTITGSHRSRLGIQSGFYQGSSTSGYDSEAFASTSSLTYHEFLSCMRSSSDKRRTILELDARMYPLSFPETNGVGHGGMDMSSNNILASLMAAGIIGSGSGSLGREDLGLLHNRIMRGTSLEQVQIQQNRNYRDRNYDPSQGPGEWMEDCSKGGLLESLSGQAKFGNRSDHHHFALSSALRPSHADVSKFSPNSCGTSAFLRPIMESMGKKYRPEVSSGVVVQDPVVDLTEVAPYWNSLFRRVKPSLSPQDTAKHTPVLSTLGNSTRSYPRLHFISSGFVDSLHSRKNMGYLTRDVMANLVPEKDDCEEALEYCRELVDIYEPPPGGRCD